MVSWTRSSASAGLAVSRGAPRDRPSGWVRAPRSKLARLSAAAARGGEGGAGRRRWGGGGGRAAPPADRAPVEALLGLGGGGPDADLVFADAGRRAARRGVRRLFGLTRLAARAAPRVFGYGAARRAARAVFGAELRRGREGPAPAGAGGARGVPHPPRAPWRPSRLPRPA